MIYSEETDEELSDYISRFLSSTKYDNIFLPLCFGSSLSDFNGLRLASHIRCSISSNQLSNIFIYSFVSLNELINNDYFDILKTSNTYLIDFKKADFEKKANEDRTELTSEKLLLDLNKINFKRPNNYFDSHSIANIWGIFQMARNANINISEIEGFEQEKFNDIYFKWLIAKNNLNKDISAEQKNEQLKYSEKIGVKIIGKIDLSKIKLK